MDLRTLLLISADPYMGQRVKKWFKIYFLKLTWHRRVTMFANNPSLDKKKLEQIFLRIFIGNKIYIFLTHEHFLDQCLIFHLCNSEI
jgi:hypothetical protein